MAIVAGAGGGGTTNSTTTATTPAIRINSGDVVVAVSYVSTTAVQFSPSSPSNPNANWQQQFLMSLSPFFVYLWTLENPAPANEPITFTRPTAAAGIAAAQVYSGVGRIGTTVQGAAIGTTSPSYSPSVTTTVPGSVIVGGFVFNRGTTQSFVPTGQRSGYIAAGGAVLIADLTVDTPSVGFIPIVSTSSQPAGFNYVSAAVVLEPVVVVGPPPPTASLSASPAVITVGQSTTLSWSSTDATTVTISGIGSVPLSGSQQVSPGDTILYTLTAVGPGGTQTTTFMVQVIQPSIMSSTGGGGFVRPLRRRQQRGAVWNDDDFVNYQKG